MNPIIKNLNYDVYTEIPSYWMIVLVPWDIILAISGIKSVIKNDRELLFEVSRICKIILQNKIFANNKIN